MILIYYTLYCIFNKVLTMDRVIANLHPEDNRQFLSMLKKLLGDFKQLETDQSICNEVLNGLAALVTLYLNCPSKFQAKRIISSFFQKCNGDNQAVIQRKLCSQLISHFHGDFSKTEDVKRIRQTVDNVHSLLENSAFGERCLESISQETLQFLIQTEAYFLSHVNKDVPPVYLNEVMHHCLVTMQTLNLVLQKTVVDRPDRMKQFSGDTKLLARLVDIDVRIIHNELLLLDCRCCCAMNVFLLIQITLPHAEYMDVIPHLLFPRKTSSVKTINIMSKLLWLSDKMFFLNMNNQSPLSFLALVFGYIAMSNPKGIKEETDLGNFFYTDELLPNLLNHGKICEDTISKAQHGKTINLWSIKLNATINSFQVCEEMVQRLQGDSPLVQSLLQYVWTHWEDQLDVIRQSAKTVFENVIKIHMALRTREQSANQSPSPFISSLLSKLFNVSWTSRGKFSALSSCVTYVGAHCLLSQRCYFPAEVLSQFNDKSLACYATELYMNMLLAHRKELSSPSSSLSNGNNESLDTKHTAISQTNEKNFLTTWIEPFIQVLCSSNKNKKNNVIEYLLPRLLKSDKKFLDHMLNILSLPEKNPGLKYGAIVACLRRARVMGILSAFPVLGKDSKSCYGVMYADIIKINLCVLDEQMRLDAFAFLCESNKTTEAVTSSEFEMLQLFIQSNLNSQSPAFRQNFLALLKKLLTRVKESLPPLMKLARREKLDVSEHVTNYKKFLEWTASLMLCNLHPGASFARRTTCLASLALMNSILTKEADNFSVSSYLDKSHIETLITCLADTYEENKVDSLTILTTHARHNGHVTTPERLLDMFQTSLTLACSTRPQDCGTAAYLMLLLINQRDIFSLIKCQELIKLKTNTAKEMLSKINTMFSSHSLTINNSEASTSTYQGYATLYLLHILVIYLQDQNEVAKQSLITAAANRPMYPTLQCIRYIMQEVKWKSYPNELISLGRHFIHLLIQTCLDLSRVVSPIVQNSSPEGNVPAEAILGPGLNMADILPKAGSADSTETTPSSSSKNSSLSQSIIDSQLLVESMPEYLIVCCWRSIKEVSLTLGKMCLQIPVTSITVDEQGVTENTANTILSLKTIQTVGDYFTQQLLESVHRGAFELAYAGFQLLCQMLWSHPNPAFHGLPNQWLVQVISDIKSEDPNSKLCATRRSAGVPFFIQAITSSEPFINGRQCFHSAMKELIVFALNESENDGSSETKADAQVHALNILRALYRDSRLREDVVPYIADGVQAAIRGFKSHLWSVRNSATLLLSALMTRMFGVKRSKDETSISKKNCQTGRSFFYHYPSLYSFLLAELEEATISVGPASAIRLHPSLYPVLLILGRLFPSMLEGSDTSLSLSAFIPYVLKCASSPVLKTRIIAARALQPLARRNQVIEVAKQLFVNIPDTQNCSHLSSSSSHIHGSLLQLCELAKLVTDFNTSVQEHILHFFVGEIMSRIWLLSPKNECFATRQSALHLVDYILSIAKLGGFSLADSEAEQVENLKAIFIASISSASSKEDRWKPLVYEYETSRAILCLKHLNELEMTNPTLVEQDSGDKNYYANKIQFQKAVVLKFLQSPFYEVRLQILCMFISSLTGSVQSASVENTIDGEGNERDNAIESSEVTDTSGHTLMESVYFSLDKDMRKSLKAMSVDLFDDILHMAVEVEDHHECLEKVFFVLAFVPDCCRLLQKKETVTINKIFTSIMRKIKIERRNEIKAAMLRFTGCFIPFLYDSIKSEETSAQYQLFVEWTNLIQDCSLVEEYPDLQISVCHVLLDNASIVLQDEDRKLELLSFHFWNILAKLLQEDDLEVKDIAASILAVTSGLKKGSLHPNYALEKFPETLLTVHKDKSLCDLTKFLVSLVVQDALVDIKVQNDNLFDKSEMNTYIDYIAFTRCVIKALSELFQQGVDLKNVTGNCAQQEFAKELLGSDLVDFLVHAFDKLEHEFSILREHCESSDTFLNPSRHVLLCHAIFRVKSLVSVFKDSFKNENTLQLKMSGLSTTVHDLMNEMETCNTFLG